MAEIAPPVDDTPARGPAPPRPRRPSTLRRILGPHLGQSIENIPKLAEFLGPGADVAESLRGSGQLMQGIQEGSLSDILGGISGVGTGMLGMAIPGPPPRLPKRATDTIITRDANEFAKHLGFPNEGPLFENLIRMDGLPDSNVDLNIRVGKIMTGDQAGQFILDVQGNKGGAQLAFIDFPNNIVGQNDIDRVSTAAIKSAFDHLAPGGTLILRVGKSNGRQEASRMGDAYGIGFKRGAILSDVHDPTGIRWAAEGSTYYKTYIKPERPGRFR